MAGRALHVVRVQRVVNTCWLFPRVLAGFLLGARQMGERDTSGRHVERGTGERGVPSQRSGIPSAVN